MSITSLNVKETEFSTKNGLTKKDRKEIANRMGVVLADTYQLFIKTQGLHWNVSGPLFYSVHKLTEEHYENMFAAVDKLAERIRSLGQKAPASYTKYGELSDISDNDDNLSVQDAVEVLIKDHETACRSIRKAIEFVEDKTDFVTADMLTGRLAWHEEAIWMLSATIAN